MKTEVISKISAARALMQPKRAICSAQAERMHFQEQKMLVEEEERARILVIEEAQRKAEEEARREKRLQHLVKNGRVRAVREITAVWPLYAPEEALYLSEATRKMAREAHWALRSRSRGLQALVVVADPTQLTAPQSEDMMEAEHHTLFGQRVGFFWKRTGRALSWSNTCKSVVSWSNTCSEILLIVSCFAGEMTKVM